MEPSDRPFLIELTVDERRVLVRGLRESAGSARPTDVLAGLIGFRDAQDMGQQLQRVAAVVEENGALTAIDWWRALLATELALAGDADAIAALRSIQIKFGPALVSVR